mmetsp:Transcript_53305/g.59576  ORF Transcript_53305/g.59576 Transcript_53305/m.59576 type:complete len:214 (+) Transcript_53305:56-697(+)|eukprot:CAMPEP_0170811698 /NCGR_PEP_ID=MMETSP0733-20121128/35441_1 /TAXON_ID=186038 /ORGANISM="Fragilariopsis kerguelensis, Strain L26-C5" /LENGTH=213 /DNA_ID=CAMNT_0011167961 /DNA_START=81 /DNA_END=725 /DNA_ORIENTATION=+
MAPRPTLTVGIQPQIAMYSVILGSVCAFGWYTEKYRRDEGDIDGHIKRLYLDDVKEANAKMPELAAAIRGQDFKLDGSMNRMVWGGKATLNKDNSTSGNNNGDNSDNDEDELGGILAGTETTTTNKNIENNDEDDDEKARRRRKRRRKRRKKIPKGSEVNNDIEETKRKEVEKIKNQKMLVLQSSIAGIAVGAITVAAVSIFFSGSTNSGGRK